MAVSLWFLGALVANVLLILMYIAKMDARINDFKRKISLSMPQQSDSRDMVTRWIEDSQPNESLSEFVERNPA